VRLNRVHSKLNIKEKKNKGFTLVELLITVSVLAIIISIAMPNFSDFIQRQQVKSRADRLLSIFTGARSEAMVSGGSVVCWTVAGAAAAGNGTTIAANTLVSMVDDTPTDATDEFTVLTELDYSDGFIANFDGDNGNDGCVAFNAQGRLVNGGASFFTTLCRATGDYENAIEVGIAISGRSSVKKADSSDSRCS